MRSRPFPAVTGVYRRQAANAVYLLLVFSVAFTGARKTPVARNRPGLLAAPVGSLHKPSGPVIQKSLLHLFAMFEWRELYYNQLHGMRSIGVQIAMSIFLKIFSNKVPGSSTRGNVHWNWAPIRV